MVKMSNQNKDKVRLLAIKRWKNNKHGGLRTQII